jgi:hypothetical protein
MKSYVTSQNKQANTLSKCDIAKIGGAVIETAGQWFELYLNAWKQRVHIKFPNLNSNA